MLFAFIGYAVVGTAVIWGLFKVIQTFSKGLTSKEDNTTTSKETPKE